LVEFQGIELAKQEVQAGIKNTVDMMNELVTVKSGLLSNRKLKNIKLAIKIRSQNKLLLYKSCIIMAITNNFIDEYKEVYVQNGPIRKSNEQDIMFILGDGKKIHCSINTIENSTVFDYIELYKSLSYLNDLDGQKILFTVSEEIEIKALSIIKIARWPISVKLLKK
jgi:hypothetical protein